MSFLLDTYAQLPLRLVRGQGSYVYDADGTEYLDLYGGHAVASTGHSHPVVVEAIARQASELLFYSNAVPLEVRDAAAQAIARISPFEDCRIFFTNSGTEANEAALKIARQVTDREEVVAMTGSFHGRTIASLSVSHSAKIRETTVPLLGETRFAQFGNTQSIRELVSDQTAAVILEPVQSVAGVRFEPRPFYADLRQICSEAGALLIFDEVQTAPGRTGEWFAAQTFGVKPDIITTAKGIASGFPAGVTIFDAPVAATVKTGQLGSTFGGGPLAMAALQATLIVMKEENLLANARRLGEFTLEAGRGIRGVRAIRACGLLIGIDTDIPGKEMQAKLLEKQIIVGTCGKPETIRLLPSLNVEQEQIARFLNALKEIME